jgi:inosine/xanthosine triphosphate pyrophosphatase family protein/dephospho-CoA kinase
MRLQPRSAFLEPERRLVVHFYTTNTEKYLQARYVFDHSGLDLKQFRSKSDAYTELEDRSSTELLTSALNEILSTLGESSLFFVEDTSVAINALSTHTTDFPGLRVKEWFANTSFDELDIALRDRGNDRGAVVRSDIALHVPGSPEPVFFRGETKGLVSQAAPDFQADPQHPWLTPPTFNGWFVPEGATRSLGSMSLEESLKYDFRVRALEKLLNRLEEYAYILNLPPQAYLRRGKKPLPWLQPELFEPDSPAFIVIGPTCAGKTTFGLRASDSHALKHIEASEIVRSLEEPRPNEAASDFAARMLEEHGADIVARRILEFYGSELDGGFALTGFRTVEELLTFREAVPRAKVVLVEAAERLRYQRYLARSRTEPLALDEFRRLDLDQARFGLLSVASHLPDTRITNESSLDSYLETIDFVLAQAELTRVPGIATRASQSQTLERSQLRRCLAVLAEAGRPLSTDEIEEISGSRGWRIRHNNANKVLKKYPGLARRLEGGASRLRYDILSAGRAYLRYVDAFVPDRETLLDRAPAEVETTQRATAAGKSLTSD